MGYCVFLRDATFWIDRRKLARYAKDEGCDAPRDSLANDESGWVFRFDRDGNVCEIDYAKEKLGADTVSMLDGLGPIVKAGSSVVLEGEDGVSMEFTFDGKQCKRRLVRGNDDDHDDEDDDEDEDEDEDEDDEGEEEHPYWGE